MKKFTSLLLIVMMTISLVSVSVFTASADEVETLQVKPVFGCIENWSGGTYFITQVSKADGANNAFFAAIKGGTYSVKLSVADEKNQKTYIVDKYAFDNPGKEFYMDGDFCFFRFAPSDYEIPVSVDCTYTIRVEVYEGETLIASGTSDTGAFNAFNDPFKADGQIIPETVPHTSKVVDGVFPKEEADTVLSVVPMYGGMENWAGSSNKGDETAVFQLLVGAHNKNGATPASILKTDVEWTLTITGSDGFAKTITLKPATVYSTTLARFETIIQEEANQFIPTIGVTYTVAISATGADGVTYTGTSAEGAFSWGKDDEPIVPDEYNYGTTEPEPTPDTPVEPEPTPDTPVEPEPTPDAPQTGDATVYAIVLAVVALMGMGVVVTKKVRA